MKSVRFKNVRSLKDTGEMAIAPITILVGANSSGKSSFLRTFPLLKQSIQKKTNGPILWAGDLDDYVDFGSFSDTVTNDGSDGIVFEFSFEDYGEDRFMYYWPYVRELFTKSLLSLKYAIKIKKGNSSEYVSDLCVKVEEDTFRVNFENNTSTIVINDVNLPYETVAESDNNEYSFFRFGNMGRSIFGIGLPNIQPWILKEFERIFKLEKQSDEREELIELSLYLIGYALVKEKKNIEDLRDVFPVEIKKERVLREICTLSVNIVQKICNYSNKEVVTSFCNSLKYMFFYYCYFGIEDYIKEYFSKVHYIAPVRATAERYYRLRNSAIDEVDYQGKNMAAFLNGLKVERMQQFQAWTENHFGFKTYVEPTEGHLSIEISRNGLDHKINLSDSGFGYSQILPIIAQLWEISSKKSKSSEYNDFNAPVVVAIEQPELHLHPAMQAKLAKSFISCIELAKENGFALQLILETHSDTIVNCFGRAISEGSIPSDAIAIYIFDKDLNNGCTKVNNSYYNNDGFLENWPIGFFNPED